MFDFKPKDLKLKSSSMVFSLFLLLNRMRLSSQEPDRMVLMYGLEPLGTFDGHKL